MAAKTLMTVEQFLALPEDGHRYELVHGELVEVASGTGRHGLTRDNIMVALRPIVMRAGGLVLTENDFQLGPDTVVRPDVAVLVASQVSYCDVDRTPVPFAPELAVEVVSANDKVEDVFGKALEYLSAGARQVWVFVPRPLREVHVLDGKTHRVIAEHEFLEAPDIVPGFRARAGDLFYRSPETHT